MLSKIVIAVLSLGFATAQAGYQMSLNEVVLFEDISELPVYQSFPCSKYIDIVTCSQTLVLESQCKKTLVVKNDVLACQSLKGDMVSFAKIDRKSQFTDETSSGGYGYKLIYSPRVELQKFVTPNGNLEYQVVVK